MPPKKKPGKKGKSKKGAEPQLDPVVPPSEKEIILKAELESLSKELDESRARIIELKSENEWLQEEANKTRVENHEYMSYLEKRTSKRQVAIVSLSDFNQKQIMDLKREEQQMTEEFEKKKEELMAVLMEKESILAKTNLELDGLRDFKTIQQEHLQRIRDLEHEIMGLRSRHTEKIQELKSAFLREKQECQQNADKKIADMSKQANQEAMLCLDVHSQRVRAENRTLRHELLLLIRKSQALREHQHNLMEQQKTLIAERQYAEDIGRLSAERKLRAVPEICAAAAAEGEMNYAAIEN